jgi:hypothetical protein
MIIILLRRRSGCQVLAGNEEEEERKSQHSEFSFHKIMGRLQSSPDNNIQGLSYSSKKQHMACALCLCTVYLSFLAVFKAKVLDLYGNAVLQYLQCKCRFNMYFNLRLFVFCLPFENDCLMGTKRSHSISFTFYSHVKAVIPSEFTRLSINHDP